MGSPLRGMVGRWAIVWLAVLSVGRSEPAPQRELEGPTVKECAESRVKMTDENFEDVLGWYQDCRKLVRKMEEGRRSEVGRAVAGQLKKASDEFLYVTQLPRRTVNALRQRIGRLCDDMLSPEELDSPRDTETRVKDTQRLTDDEPKSSELHRMSHEGRSGEGAGRGGGATTGSSAEGLAEECPHSPWENLPPALIATLFVLATILVLVLFLFMCIRYCLRGSHTCCHESQASSQNLEACLKRILKGEGDACCGPPSGKKHKEKKKKKKKGSSGTC